MALLASNIDLENESCSTRARGTKWRTALIWSPISLFESWDQTLQTSNITINNKRDNTVNFRNDNYKTNTAHA